MRRSIVGAISLTVALVACSSGDGDVTDSAGGAWDTESPNDETKSTHLWVVNRGVDILTKHKGDVASAANTLAWMNDAQCKTHWQDGLLQADFLAPFNAASGDLTVPTGAGPATDVEAAAADLESKIEVGVSQATWMSHFYDPDTGMNYQGISKSDDLSDDAIAHPIAAAIKQQVEVNGPVPLEAKGSALYRVGRVMKLLAGTDVPSDHKNEPEAARDRGCYELGLALHYFTDITQPQHAANFAATDRPRLLHSNWEGYAEQIQAKFVRSDWSAGPTGNTEDEIQKTALASKAHWKTADGQGPLLKAILDAYRAGSTFDASGKATANRDCKAAADELNGADAIASLLHLGATSFISLDLPQCWKNNLAVNKETGSALGDAQEMTARFLATLTLPPHPAD
jgi:phospholipase C